jgi:hypothetical protein
MVIGVLKNIVKNNKTFPIMTLAFYSIFYFFTSAVSNERTNVVEIVYDRNIDFIVFAVPYKYAFHFPKV